MQKRLDRVLVNPDWRLKFAEADIYHLPHFKSNHKPLLMQLEIPVKVNTYRRSFRFEAAWVTHEDLNQVIRDNWRYDSSNWNLQMGEL